MDDPVAEIPGIIHDLTQSKPSVQRHTVEKYFTSNASFQHPFCRTGSFEGSRFLIQAIYRWYKILSPRIQLEVKSIAYDSKNLICYVNIDQIFQIWFIPFIYAPVNLTTVLRLMHNKDDGKYYLNSQDDLYQVNQFIKFFFPGGTILVWLWQMIATLACVVLAILFWPISWVEEHGSHVATQEKQRLQAGQRRLKEEKDEVFKTMKDYRNGEIQVTAPTVQQS